MYVITALRDMDAGMCAVIAQVLPVFWLVVVVPGRGLTGGATPHLWDPLSAVGTVTLLALTEGIVLYGAGHDGLNAYFASLAWGMTFLILLIVAANQVVDVLAQFRAEDGS